MNLFEARTLTVSIARCWQDVYDYASDPRNLPAWAGGFARAVRQDDRGWIVETSQGDVRLRFAEKNALGVLDHVVGTPSGEEVRVPMRVVPNGEGSEILFTLIRAPEMTDAQFDQDENAIASDLAALKEILERVG